jgi:hypothetical protein
MRPSSFAAFASISKVLSVLPSATNTISCGPPAILSKTSSNRRRSSGRTLSSWRIGIATERRNPVAFLTLYPRKRSSLTIPSIANHSKETSARCNPGRSVTAWRHSVFRTLVSRAEFRVAATPAEGTISADLKDNQSVAGCLALP